MGSKFTRAEHSDCATIRKFIEDTLPDSFAQRFSAGPGEATGIWGSSILLERTYGIRAEDQQAIPDILDSNGRVSRL
jgi:hypothetical protein